MIIGKDRAAVIGNIKQHVEHGEFHSKVELNDPHLTTEEIRNITTAYCENRHELEFKAKSMVAVWGAQMLTHFFNRKTKIVGLEKIPHDLGGVIITSNHFSPLENTVIRHLTNRMGRSHLNIISQATNFAMTGPLGFLMNYANTIPISTEPRYLARDFLSILREKLVVKKQAVLLYPEQEMWFNYRKPRPPKNGAYYYAVKLHVPILSCFVEIVDLDKDDTDEFKQVSYILHVLGVLYPDDNRSAQENTQALAEADYALKKEAYEQAYGKPLTYTFEDSDIAGWKGSLS